jgi:hypothetical protein
LELVSVPIMKAISVAAPVTFVLAKILVGGLIAWLALSSSISIHSMKMARDDVQILDWLITIGATSWCIAVLLLSPRSLVRVLVHVLIILVCTILGMCAAFAPGIRGDSSQMAGLIVFIGGSFGSLFGYISVTVIWYMTRWDSRKQNHGGRLQKVSASMRDEPDFEKVVAYGRAFGYADRPSPDAKI